MDQNITAFASKALEKFNVITNEPQNFLLQNKQTDKLKGMMKEMYDFTRNDKNLPNGNGLPELIINQFGHEEIWSQLELENESLYFKLVTDISKVLAQQASIAEDETVKSNDAEELGEDEEEGQEEVGDGEESLEEKSESGGEVEENGSVRGEKLNENEDDADDDEIKDRFFNKKEMEQFLNEEDHKVMRGAKKKPVTEDSDAESEESIDLFAESDEEDDDDENVSKMRYGAFFDEPNANPGEDQNGHDENDSASDEDLSAEEEDIVEEPTEEAISTFELRQSRLKKKIGHLENAALAEKSWQLKGETAADKRPQNSLLEEILEFDVTARPNLVVTEQTNMLLEDVILQRIKDRAWDSVKRKAKPVDDPLEYKKKLALNQEKSKESLAQIYEKEYLKQKENSGDQPDPDEAEKTATTAKIDNLFSKLDMLSHYFFTPRLVKPEAKIVSNLPAVTMEEVAPVGVSDAALLAPEEVRAKKKGDPMSKSERTTTDKKRERRAKKAKQRKRKLELAGREFSTNEPASKKAKRQLSAHLLKQVTKDRNVTQMQSSASTVGKSSEKFFNQLQDEVKNQIQSKTSQKTQNKAKSKFNAKKLKL